MHFLPAGTTTRPVPDDAGVPLTGDETAEWARLEPLLTPLMPQPVHPVSTEFVRQLVHEQSGLMVTWEHDDRQASLPLWSVNVQSGAFDALVAVVEVVERETGLVGIDASSDTRFLDHTGDARAMFGTVAGAFEEAMERQTVLGWLRSRLRRSR